LNELFDHWVNDTNGNINISYFKHILNFILLQKKSVCTYTSCVGRWIGVHHDGEVVPCNRFFPKEYSYGNIWDYDDIGEAFESEGFKKLIQQAIIRRKKCQSCEIYNFCNGGCNNVALNENGIENNGGRTCRILRGVYRHINDFLDSICLSIPDMDKKYNPKFIELLNESRK
jgi:uncharacterized protein